MMPYSTNPALLVQRMSEMLELKAGRACQWHTTADPQITQRLATRIRENLWIAHTYPKIFPELAQAYHAFSIHVVGPGVVEAKPWPDITLAASTGEPWGKAYEISTVARTTAQQCIDAWMAHLPSNDPVNFQQTTLPDDELQALWHWAIQTDTHPKLMILKGPGHMTLALAVSSMESVAWHPPKPPAKPEKNYDF